MNYINNNEIKNFTYPLTPEEFYFINQYYSTASMEASLYNSMTCQTYSIPCDYELCNNQMIIELNLVDNAVPSGDYNITYTLSDTMVEDYSFIQDLIVVKYEQC